LVSPSNPGADEVSSEYLRDLLKEADKEEKEIILPDDTNCDLRHPQNSNTKKLKMIYSDYQFEQLKISALGLLLWKMNEMSKKLQNH